MKFILGYKFESVVRGIGPPKNLGPKKEGPPKHIGLHM